MHWCSGVQGCQVEISVTLLVTWYCNAISPCTFLLGTIADKINSSNMVALTENLVALYWW